MGRTNDRATVAPGFCGRATFLRNTAPRLAICEAERAVAAPEVRAVSESAFLTIRSWNVCRSRGEFAVVQWLMSEDTIAACCGGLRRRRRGHRQPVVYVSVSTSMQSSSAIYGTRLTAFWVATR